MTKRALPLSKVYALVEPGPVLLLSTAGEQRANVMTLSWHTMLEFEPPLVGCVVSDRNHSFGLLQATGEAVLNIPGVEIARQVVGCGNCSGADVDKFARFGLTPRPAAQVRAPLIDECFASLECRVVDCDLVAKYSLFVLEVVQAWVEPRWRARRTIHHEGYGRFRVAGDVMRLRSRMR